MRSVDNYQRLLDLVPSPVNGITLCQGNFRLMTDDIPAAIRQFGAQEKIFFVHFRDVRGTRRELRGDVARRRADRPARVPAHLPRGGLRRVRCGPTTCPTVEGDSNDHPGYSLYGRLFALGYIRGLMESVGR